jgi:hypothetical protein
MLVFMLAPVLWGTAWFHMWCMYRIPEKSWRRFAIGIPLLIAMLGVTALQFHLVMIVGPRRPDRHYFDSVIIVEWALTIALMLYVAIREDRAKKMRATARDTSSMIASPVRAAALPPISIHGHAVKMDITAHANGRLVAVIPPPLANNKYYFLYGIGLVLSGLIGVMVLQFRLAHATSEQQQSLGIIGFIRILQAAVALGIGYIVASILTGKRTLTVDPSRLEIRYSLLGLPVSRGSFKNPEVKSLRYAHWRTQSRRKLIEHSGIRFEAGSETHTFGSQLTAEQASELIGRMRKVYAFPIAREGQT